MTQYAPTNPIVPGETSGTELAEIISDNWDAENTSHKGDAVPSYANEGMVWAGKNGRTNQRLSSGSYLATHRPITSIADLRAFGAGEKDTDLISVQVSETITPYMWDAASVAADDGDGVILPTGHTGAGRWLKRASYATGAGGLTWVNETQSVAYTDSETFEVYGDQSDIYVADRALFLNQTSDDTCFVSSSLVDSAGNTIVTIKDGTVDAGLSAVSYGLLPATAPATVGDWNRSTLVPKTANYTGVTADAGETTVMNGTDLVYTTPTVNATNHELVFNVQNINATDLTLTTVVGVTVLKENESCTFIVDNTNSECRALGSHVAGGGAWSVKESGTFSGVANKDFTGLSKSTEIFLTDLTGAIAGALSMLTSDDNGVSFDSGANDYAYTNITAQSSGATVTNNFDNTAPEIRTGVYFPTASTDDASQEIFLPNPQDTAKYTHCTFTGAKHNSGTSYIAQEKGAGIRWQAAKVDAIRIFNASGGNISGSYVVMELN